MWPKARDIPGFEQRLATFKAHDPTLQEWCVAALNGSRAGQAMDGQDIFVWRHLFAARLSSSTSFSHGVYVESGANHWRAASNTFFFDKCLGWDGLCVEPNRQFHAGLRAHRSCVLVPECLSDVPNSTMLMAMDDVRSHVHDSRRVPMPYSHFMTEAEDSELVPVTCNPLEVMLRRLGRTHVDYWALDIEGFELPVLRATNWSRLSVGVLQVEGFHYSSDGERASPTQPSKKELEIVLSQRAGLHKIASPMEGSGTEDMLFASRSILHASRFGRASQSRDVRA